MVDKIAVLSLLVASLSFGANATEIDEEAKENPAIEVECPGKSESKDITEEVAKAKDESMDELKEENKCDDKDQDCDEEKMIEEEKSKKNDDSAKED